MALVLQRTLVSWRPDEAIRMLSDAVEHPTTGRVSPHARARLLLARAAARRETCDFLGAEADLAAVSELATKPSPENELPAVVTAEVAFQRGQIYYCRGEIDAAQAALKAASGSLEPPMNTREAALLEGRIESLFATIQADRFRSPTALTHYARAIALLEQSGDTHEIASTRFWWDANRFFFGQRIDEHELERRAKELAHGGLHVQAGWYTLLAAAHHQDRGALWEAFRLGSQAEKRGACLGVERLRLGSVCVLGLLLEEMGDLGEALVRYERAARDYAALGLRYEVLARIYLGGALAQYGDLTSAEATFERVDAMLAATPDSRFEELANLRRGHLDLERSRRALSTGDFALAAKTLDGVRDRIAAAEKPRRDIDTEQMGLSGCNYEARVLVRILKKACEQPHGNVIALRVADDGSGFSVAGGPKQSVRGGPVVRSVLAALAESRVQSPGVAVTTDELFAKCWPGEQALPDSRRLRVRVTVRRLREAGLGQVITTGPDGGYLVDPAIPVELVATP